MIHLYMDHVETTLEITWLRHLLLLKRADLQAALQLASEEEATHRPPHLPIVLPIRCLGTLSLTF